MQYLWLKQITCDNLNQIYRFFFILNKENFEIHLETSQKNRLQGNRLIYFILF